MSIAPESLAASRFRELRKLDEKIQKLSQDLAEAREVVGVLTTEKAAAAQRDKQAYASALSEGKARPAKREEEKVAAELSDTELRAEALKLAIDSALDERAKLLKENHPVWRLKAMRELSKAKTRYEAAITELEAARDALSDEAALVAWLDSGSSISAATDLLGGRIGADREGRQPVNFSRTIEELRRDAEHLAGHPDRGEAPESRIDVARVKVGAVFSEWTGGN
jgi:hypothetical protein